MASDFVERVKGASPFPWRQVVHANGIIQLFDAAGKEVPIFTMTEFVCFITTAMSKTKVSA